MLPSCSIDHRRSHRNTLGPPPAQAVDAFGNKSYEDAVIVHKSKLELEKEAGESLKHKSVHTPSRAELHSQCAPCPKAYDLSSP